MFRNKRLWKTEGVKVNCSPPLPKKIIKKGDREKARMGAREGDGEGGLWKKEAEREREGEILGPVSCIFFKAMASCVLGCVVAMATVTWWPRYFCLIPHWNYGCSTLLPGCPDNIIIANEAGEWRRRRGKKTFGVSLYLMLFYFDRSPHAAVICCSHPSIYV